MAAMSCKEFRRGWKETREKTEEKFSPKIELLTHLSDCESCCTWCLELIEERLAALGKRLT